MSPSSSPPPPIRACLFDMDGLLIDSEDLYSICTNAVLAEYGRPKLPWSIKAQLQGRPGPESQRIFQEWAHLPITPADFTAKISALQRQHFPSTKPLPGVPALLRTLSTSRAHLALATSSHEANFHLKTNHLADLFAVFAQRHRVLGDDPRIAQGRGKPAPDIYLLALETINVDLRAKGAAEVRPEECLVFEDSVPGVESGRRAGMQVVWCPHPGLREEYRGREREVLAGLTGAHVDEEVDGAERVKGASVKGQPGELDDGWARLLETLEGFPYASYGIEIGGEKEKENVKPVVDGI
ncbi:HAD superfamily hydrolase [Mytilinidion resinicola]|uniref:HAD superfamily hydrolase n=1 Tax=Mytilinidion resinicola TaxID=574789 RepID=A0A6A6Y8A7_9PEZI|nr:HAD superfamily hydrolase [Mytilinidion resinicola]KAF2804930.1 HAD superfamily hydrolase [Mytilinidion resinicola]